MVGPMSLLYTLSSSTNAAMPILLGGSWLLQNVALELQKIFFSIIIF
jgi:hypothetical protein